MLPVDGEVAINRSTKMYHPNLKNALEKNAVKQGRQTGMRLSENLPETGRMKRRQDFEERKSWVCSGTGQELRLRSRDRVEVGGMTRGCRGVWQPT